GRRLRPLNQRFAFSPDGRMLITGSVDYTARLWDTSTGQPIGRPLQHAGRVWAVAFSPDGRTVLTGCDDQRAYHWDAQSGQPAGRPGIHQGWVDAVAFSPDGRVAVTGATDGAVQRILANSTGRVGRNGLGKEAAQADERSGYKCCISQGVCGWGQAARRRSFGGRFPCTHGGRVGEAE